MSRYILAVKATTNLSTILISARADY